MLKIRKAINRRSLRQSLSVALLLLSALTLSVGLLVTSPAASWAADASAYQSSNQSIGQAASLIAPEPDQKITIYQRPEAKSKAGYGVNGDAVTVLERVSDNQSMTWNHIRFDNPPYAEGWVQETFTHLQTANTQDQNRQTMGGDRYLGNQPAPSNQQNSQQRQSYSQRQN